MKSQRFFGVACAAAMLLISASAFADDAKCRDAFNKANRNVGNQEQKANRKCIKDGSGDVSACVNAVSAKAADKETKVEDLFATGGKCDPNAAFGTNNGGAPAGDDAAKAAEKGTDDILRDLWGNPVDGVVADDKCADAVAKRSGKIYDTILKAFRKCNKDTTPGSQVALDACVGVAISDAKVTTFAGKLASDVTNKCNASAPIVAGTDDGKCAGETTQGDFSDCAVEDAKCNACLAINTMTGGSAPCDLLDDGSVNGSCGGPPPNQHACAFDGATDNSALTICFLGVCPPALDIKGSIDIDCPGAPGGNGKRSCSCTLGSLDPFVISGVGTVCTGAAGPCADGEQDCDGGNNLNVDIVADHKAGTCTSNADCASSCTTYCGGISKVKYNSGCESFCQGGTRDNQACICDLATGATCSGGVAGVNDCPLGSCEGKDNDVAPDQCHCWCVDEATPPASTAGALECRVGVAIRIEADPVCDNNQVLVRLAPQCAPFTSGTASVTVLNANEGATTQGPYVDSGANETCANFDLSTTTGYEVVANLAFFDSTIGDLEARLRIDCQ